MAPASPTPSKKPIDDIKYKLLHPALTSHYECYFPFPGSQEFNELLRYNGITNVNDATDSLTIFCSEASLPGSQLNTHELNNDFTGVTQRHAYRRLYDDRADFTFYVDINYTPIRIFEAWMRFISGEQVNKAEELTNHYRIRYPIYYKTTIYITKFERSFHLKKSPNKSSITYSFFNAFPLAVTSIPVSYESSQLLKCTVSFTYDRYVQGPSGKKGLSGQPFTSPATGVPNLSEVSYSGGIVSPQNIFAEDVSISGNYFNNISPNQDNRQFYGPGFGSSEEANRQAAILRGENVQ